MPNRCRPFVISGAILLGCLNLRAAETAVPSRDEVLAEIRLLRDRLATLEAAVLNLPAEVDDPTPVPAPPPPTPRRPPTPPEAQSQKEPIVTFYGFVKVDAFYESQDTHTDAIPFWVSRDLPHGRNGGGEFGLTAKESRFGMKVQGPALADGRLGGVFEFDFYGNLALSGRHAYTPRSRHAFVEWKSPGWSYLAGKTWETYLITFPKNVNFSAYNMQGQLGMRRTQVRVSREVPAGEGTFGLHFALAEPLAGVHGADLDGDLRDDAAEADLPFIEWKTTYRQGRALVGLAGFFGREELAAAEGAAADNYDAWAVILGGELPLGPALTLRGTLWTGTNLDSAWGAIGQGLNLVQRRSIDASGGWAQLGWVLSPAFDLNLGVSRDDPRDRHLEDGQRTRNESLLLNGFYRLDEHLILGLEWLYLRTGYKGAPTATSHRLQSTVKYTF
jgi:hypothetical protein